VDSLIKSPILDGVSVLLAPSSPSPMAGKLAYGGSPRDGLRSAPSDTPASVTPGGSSHPESAPPAPEASARQEASFAAAKAAALADLKREHAAALAAKIADAEERGFAEGQLRGREEAIARLTAAVQAIEEIQATANASIAALLVEGESLIGAIALEAVTRIIGEKLVDVALCRSVVEQTIGSVGSAEAVAIHVSPIDFDRLRRETDADFASRIRGLALHADETVPPGGCILMLRGGSIDARLDRQVEAFAASLREAARA
jgi:flagellar assembly protein FliH